MLIPLYIFWMKFINWEQKGNLKKYFRLQESATNV